ncbi:hypothetical protein THAOC_37321 [Thalassiosira oceanica]|uniref:Sulfotransferase domain-containing protein n=1 Tax=Thalassiosira oceanica TaxID=159749 RepID=K0RCE4_THAOC|nr:hypothetical protein THAOC_37321 [Thalassiosira oceanica]|eukprot:EJK44162.1 hypothetical protein THAOC_37321 [Thalassiosira oceanica]
MATPNLIHLPSSAAAEPLQVIGTGLGRTGTDSTPHLIRLLFVVTLILLPSAAAEPLQVIGAGLGRTGTDSLRLALNELGFGPTYHMCEVLGVPGTLGDAYKRGHVDVWAELGEAGGETDERTWDDLFRGYRSAVDMPSQVFAVQLAEKYPGAKVVLTVRASAGVWHESINAAWCRFSKGGMSNWLDQAFFDYRGSEYFNFFLPFERRFRRQNAALEGVFRRTLGGPYESTYSTGRICSDREYAVGFYEAWNSYIMKNIPEERLLVLETGDPDTGRKLGLFLGLDEETAGAYEYPHANSRRLFAVVVAIGRIEAALTLLPPLLLYLAGKKLWRRIGGVVGRIKQD